MIIIITIILIIITIMIIIKKKSKKKIHAIFIDEDNIRRCSFRNLKKIVTKSDVLFAVNVILNFSNIQNFENPSLDTKIIKKRNVFLIALGKIYLVKVLVFFTRVNKWLGLRD